MKIGIVSPYSFDYPGGVMHHILDFSKSMIKKGPTVKVLAPGTIAKNLPNYVSLFGEAISIPGNGSVARIKFGPVASNDVLAWITINDFDILHVHEPTNPSVSMLALIHAQCPVVATFHAYYKSSPLTQIVGMSVKKILKKVEIPIAVSENARQTAIESFDIDPIVIPNGINISNYEKPKNLSISKLKKNTILFIGRVNEKRKGLTLLLNSYQYILKYIHNVKLLVAGTGKLSTKQINLIQKYKNIKFLGTISEKKKLKLFFTSSVYVAPQIFGESFGIVLLEAFASKIPVVASAISAFIDVTDGGKMAKLFAVNDKKHLAKKVIDVLKLENETNEIVNNAYKYVQKYDWSKVCKKIEKVYKSLLK